MLQRLKILWDFTRPHTIIGSFLSITTLYLLACKDISATEHITLYGWTLLSALTCNLFITGLNQITDWEMDKINKPFLPIASGALSLSNARNIIGVSLVICLWSAWMAAPLMFGIIFLIILIGSAYSLPPLRLKRHHITAAFCIIAVRGLLVNLAIGAAFDHLIHGAIIHWNELVLLTIFISVFSLAIAWFKDLYDTKGDDLYQIRTFPLLFSIKTTFYAGNALVIAAYLFSVVYSWWTLGTEGWLLLVGHIALLLLFLGHIFTSSLQSPEGIYRFYIRFWVFLFGEYLLLLWYALV